MHYFMRMSNLSHQTLMYDKNYVKSITILTADPCMGLANVGDI